VVTSPPGAWSPAGFWRATVLASDPATSFGSLNPKKTNKGEGRSTAPFPPPRILRPVLTTVYLFVNKSAAVFGHPIVEGGGGIEVDRHALKGCSNESGTFATPRARHGRRAARGARGRHFVCAVLNFDLKTSTLTTHLTPPRPRGHAPNAAQQGARNLSAAQPRLRSAGGGQ
jgi:hypothetical protein